MRIRTGFLLTCAAGALLIGAGPTISTALAADTMPTKAMPAADPVPFWWFHGEVEAGGRFFLNNPNRNGVNSAGQNSLAKFYEYRDLRPGPFGNFHLATGTSNGLYQVDVWGKNVGYNDQRYDLTASKAGQHYFNFQWDETPHLYSTSAQTIYNGVDTNALTLVPGLAGGQLFGANANGNPISAANAIAVRNLINANVHQTDIGIRRDTAAAEYRWTPTDAWDVKADYSHMRRTGSQVDGVTFGWGTSNVRVDAPRPVNDTTENYGLGGEYAGTSPWGKKFNFKLAYNGSTYTNTDPSYTIQNPFCNAAGTLCDRTTTADAPSAQMSLWPSNNANAVTGTLGADLPANSRYMGTVSYTMMRQNAAFLPFTNNTNAGLVVGPGAIQGSLLSALPASSLNGAINTLLSNNVLTTQITPDLKSKLSYRYYNFDNNTPSLTFPSAPGTSSGAFIGADTTVVTNYPSPKSLQASYTRQNAGAELDWHATRQLNLGAGYGFERYDRTFAEVGTTNEHSGKIFGDWKPANWVTARASYSHSARRFSGNYDNYNNVISNMWVVGGVNGLTPTAGLVENQAYRNFMYADRDRDQAKFSLAVDVMPKVTVTPTAGLKYDDYLNNVNIGSITTTCPGGSPNCGAGYAGTYNGVLLNGTQPGLKKDNSWNWGLETSIVATPDTTFMVSYTREYSDKQLLFCGNSAAGGSNGTIGQCGTWSNNPASGTGALTGSAINNMKDTVDTFIARVRHALIPNKLDVDLGYTLSIANSSTSFNPGPFNSYSAGAVTQSGGPFPDTKTTFQRFDVMGTYKFDNELVQRNGFKGEVMAKLRYAYERNRVTNWQNDMMQTYIYANTGALTNTSLGYMTWLAGNNPNYDVQLIAASLAWKW